MRRGGGFRHPAYLSTMHRQIKPQKFDLKDIKEGDKDSRKPPVLTIYILHHFISTSSLVSQNLKFRSRNCLFRQLITIGPN